MYIYVYTYTCVYPSVAAAPEGIASAPAAREGIAFVPAACGRTRRPSVMVAKRRTPQLAGAPAPSTRKGFEKLFAAVGTPSPASVTTVSDSVAPEALVFGVGVVRIRV